MQLAVMFMETKETLARQENSVFCLPQISAVTVAFWPLQCEQKSGEAGGRKASKARYLGLEFER